MIDRRNKSKLTLHTTNPFLVQTIASANIGNKQLHFAVGKDETVVNTATGALNETQAAFKLTKVIDKSKFVMLYMALMNDFFKFSKSSQKLVRTILNEVSESGMQKDSIYLSLDVVKDYLKEHDETIGKTSYSKAIKDLIASSLIAESNRTNIWFVNPAMVFNGDRATFITELIKENPDIVDHAIAFKEQQNPSNESPSNKVLRGIGVDAKLAKAKAKTI